MIMKITITDENDMMEKNGKKNENKNEAMEGGVINDV